MNPASTGNPLMSVVVKLPPVRLNVIDPSPAAGIESQIAGSHTVASKATDEPPVNGGLTLATGAPTDMTRPTSPVVPADAIEVARTASSIPFEPP